MSTPRPGVAEQDAGEVAAAAVAAIREAAHAARDAGHRVAGVSFSAAMHGLLGVDAAGRPLTPLLTWADHRASPQAERLRTGARGLALHRRTGTPVHPMSPLVKLRWFAEEDARTAADVRHWCGVKDHLLRELTGELVTDHSLASGTGLFNLGELDWDAEALDYAGVDRDRLPQPVPTTQRLALTDAGARRLGLPRDTPVVAGGGDGPLANLGLGAVRPGTVACSIGTSGALRVVAEDPRVDEQGRVFCYVLAPGRYVIGGAVNNGGIVLDWLADAVAPDADGKDALLEAAARVPAGSGGLLFLPYLLGERAPHWSGNPRGAYVGLVREHRREHLLRSAVEGVSLQLAVVLAALAATGIEIREIRATGGFARSALWRGILASAFGRPIGFAASPEGSALGAALLGMTELGMLDSLDRAAEIVRITERQQPDSADADVYARLLPIFDAGFGALADAFEALTALAGDLPLAFGAPPQAPT
jgi:gluconokinase